MIRKHYCAPALLLLVASVSTARPVQAAPPKAFRAAIRLYEDLE